MRSQLIAAVAVAFVLGCASTQSVSVRNPELASKRFHKVVVVGNFGNLMARKQMEDGLVAALRKKGIDATPSLSLFAADADRETRLAAYNSISADAVLMVKVDDAHVTEHVVSGPTATTNASANCYGSSCYGQSTTTVNPGTTARKPHMTFSAALFDVETAKMAWQGQAQGNGNGFANFDTVVASFQDKLVDDLRAADLFASR